MKPTLLVMAAGMGSRYGGLKQIDPVGPNGETIIEYSIFDAIRAGFGKVVFIIREEFEAAFREGIIAKFAGAIETDCVYQRLDDGTDGFVPPVERVKPWGTAHAILTAREAIQEPFAVINADDFYGRDSFRVIGEFLARSNPASLLDSAMVGFTLCNTLSEHGHVARGVCSYGPDRFLRQVVERTNIIPDGAGARCPGDDGQDILLTGREIVSMNFWGFQPPFFSELKRLFLEFLAERGTDPKAEFFIPVAVSRLIEAGLMQVRVMETPDKWFGVTYREDKPRVEASVSQMVASGVYPTKLWS
jgi:dTDP-glucose pyrophosphorylase